LAGDSLVDMKLMRRALDIVGEAADLEGVEQRGYVRAACAGDEELLREVESLLEFDSSEESLLDGTAWDGMDSDDIEMVLSGGGSARQRRGGPTRVRCGNDHFYDPTDHASCPICGEAERGSRKDPAGTAALFEAPVPDGPEKREFRRGETLVGWLVCIAGADRGRDYPLYGQRSALGREMGMQIRIDGDAKIAAVNHAIVTYEPGPNSFSLASGDSNSNTYLNDRFVSGVVALKAHDVIDVGDTKLLFVPLCGELFRWK
jgi:hypothetical protein